MGDRNERVNIYLSASDNERLIARGGESNGNLTQVHLIQSNDKLRRGQDDMRLSLAANLNKIADLEDEEDRLEKSIVNLRGFAKNLGAMNRINEKLVKKNMAFQGKTRALLSDKYDSLYRIMCHHVFMLIGFVVGMFILWMFNFVEFGTCVSEVTLHGTIVMVFMFTFREEFQHVKSIRGVMDLKDTEYYTLYKRCQPSITELEEELKDIKKGNDFLNDLLDRQ